MKIEAGRLEHRTRQCPHGIKYCLTLHDRYGKRVMGFDNAHPIVTRKRGRYKGRSVIYDHRHTHPVDQGTPYAFESAEQLITDFFAEVDRIIKGK